MSQSITKKFLKKNPIIEWLFSQIKIKSGAGSFSSFPVRQEIVLSPLLFNMAINCLTGELIKKTFLKYPICKWFFIGCRHGTGRSGTKLEKTLENNGLRISRSETE